MNAPAEHGQLAPAAHATLHLVLASLLIAAAVVLVYARSCDGPFIFDDYASVVDNPSIRQLWPATAMLSPGDNRPTTGRPAVNVSFALNYAAGGLQACGYRVVNIAFHAGSALLLLLFLRRTLRTPRLARRFGRGAHGAALAIAVIWAVHPLQTEAVVYITQRTELMASFFYLLTMYAAAAAAMPLREQRSASRRAWAIAAVLACALGMMCKQIVASAPLMVLLYDRVLLYERWSMALRQRWGLYAGLAATWGVLAALMLAGVQDAIGFGGEITGLQYLATQAGVILHYLRLCFWPWPLTVSYHWPVLSAVGDAWLAGLVVLALLGATVVALLRRWPAGLAGAWFFLILAPSSSFVPIVTEIAAERRMYLPLAAVVTVMVLGAWQLIGGWKSRESQVAGRASWGGRDAMRLIGGAAAAAAVVVVLACVSIARLRDFETEQGIWRAALRVDESNPVANQNLATVLTRDGLLEGAIRHYQQALAVRPTVQTHHNLGLALAQAGRLSDAVSQYRAALALSPTAASVMGDLGSAYARMGKPAEAAATLEQATAIEPHDANLQTNLGAALLLLGQPDRALPRLNKALTLNPRDVNALVNRAHARLMLGDIDAAMADCRAALAIDARHADAHLKLGQALAMADDFAGAEAAFDEALRLQPDNAEAKQFLERVRQRKQDQQPKQQRD